jgi:hypothetical protein
LVGLEDRKMKLRDLVQVRPGSPEANGDTA